MRRTFAAILVVVGMLGTLAWTQSSVRMATAQTHGEARSATRVGVTDRAARDDAAGRDEAPGSDAKAAAPRFKAIDIFIDSGDVHLAAFQFEFKGGLPGAKVRIVGIEESTMQAFRGKHFYYDGRAIEAGHSERVIIASFSTQPAASLPKGKVRVATVHCMIEGAGEPRFDLTLKVATDAAGKAIQAVASFQEG